MYQSKEGDICEEMNLNFRWLPDIEDAIEMTAPAGTNKDDMEIKKYVLNSAHGFFKYTYPRICSTPEDGKFVTANILVKVMKPDMKYDNCYFRCH